MVLFVCHINQCNELNQSFEAYLISYCIHISAVDRCLSFDYSLGNYEQGSFLTEINVYVEGTGKTKTNVKNLKTTTDYTWKTETVSISAVDNLVVMIYTDLYRSHVIKTFQNIS